MFDQLLLNGKRYHKEQLIQLCWEKINHPNMSAWEAELYLFIQKWLDDSDTITLKTSGSTGNAKYFNVSKQAMVQSAQMTGRYFQLKAEQSALLCLPVEHIAGQMMAVRAFVLGLNLIAVDPKGRVLASISNEGIDFAAMLPLQLYKLLFEEPSYQDSLEKINTLLIGGASISPVLLEAIQSLKLAVYHSYGMTETLSHIAIRRLNTITQQPFYKLLDGVEALQDARGCLVINAPHLKVYKLISNDLVKLHNNNQIELLGRFDNVINTGGIKLNPEQLETKIAKFIAHRRFYISSIEDDKLGNKIILLIEGSALTEIELNSLELQIQSVLTQYERPKAIYFIKKFAKTVTGKVRRQARFPLNHFLSN